MVASTTVDVKLGNGNNNYSAVANGTANQQQIINGQGGDDVIQGGNLNDVINGGKGADRMHGGLGSDTFVFTAGDLINSLAGSVDYITDFQGAGIGKYDAAAIGTDQDIIQFYGFGAGSHLDFVKDTSNGLQYYYLTDPTNAANNGYILIGSTNGAHLTSADWVFK